jgi:hypothetical protein
VLVVLELDARLFELAAALDVNLLRRVDEDVGDGRVGEQGLQRPEAEQLVADFADEPLAVGRGERRVLGQQEVFGEAGDLGVELLGFELAELGQVHPVDDGAVQARLHLLVEVGPDGGVVARAAAAEERRAARGRLAD